MVIIDYIFVSNSTYLCFVPAVGEIPAKICLGAPMTFRLKFVPGSVTFRCFPERQNGKSAGLDGGGGDVHTND